MRLHPSLPSTFWKMPTRNAMRIMVAALGLLALASCQTADPGDGDAVGVVERSVSTPLDGDWKDPDSASWAVGSNKPQAMSSIGKTPDGMTKVTFITALKSTDIVTIHLWAAGMRLGQFQCQQSATDPAVLDVVERSANWDKVAERLITEQPVANRHDRDSIHAGYARHLVDGDADFSGFPANKPDGIDTAKLYKDALVYALSLQVPMQAVASRWSLGLDQSTLHDRVVALVASGTVAPKDTIAAFPPHPVRVTVGLSVGDLEVGQAIPVRGSFVCDSGLSQVDARVFQGSQEKTSLF